MNISIDKLGKPIDKSLSSYLNDLLRPEDIKQINLQTDYNESYIRRLLFYDNLNLNHKNLPVVTKAIELAQYRLEKLNNFFAK
jgi:hypothetical protein